MEVEQDMERSIEQDTGQDTSQDMEYIPLRNDLLFHMVFTRNMVALKALLSALLHIPEKRIGEIEVLNPIQYSESISTRLTVLDLKVHIQGGTYVLVEMQVRKFDFWTNRALAYASRAVADQVKGEFNYSKLEPVIQISIMDYSLFPEHRRFFAKYTPRDEEGFEYTNKLRFYVLDLTQIETASDEEKSQGLVEWARAFRAGSWDEVNNIENTGVMEAAKTMELIMANPIEREMLRMRRDAEIDRRTEILSAERRGKAQGVKQGIEQGIEQEKVEIAGGMKRKGFAPSVISELCGLTLEEVHAL